MQILATGIYIKLNNRGFTLLETMVIIVIAGVIISMIAIKFKSANADDYKLKLFAKEMKSLINLAKNESVTKVTLYRFKIQNGKYGIQKWGVRENHQQPTWLWDNRDSLFKLKKIPRFIKISIRKPETTLKLSDGQSIDLYPSGEISPFIMYLGTKLDPQKYVIQGEASGIIK